MRIGIIGHGFVGQSVEVSFTDLDEPNKHSISIYDKFKGIGSLAEVIDKSEVIFLCLPTPFKGDFDRGNVGIDLTDYNKFIDELCNHSNMHEGKIIVIKSTVVPGTTQKWIDKYPDCTFCFVPEFLTEKNWKYDSTHADRIVIGSNDLHTQNRMVELYKSMLWTHSVPILVMSPTEAEFVKYTSNIMLASKVATSNMINSMAVKLGADWKNIAEGVGADKRIGRSHMQISEERGFGGKCLWKDGCALIGLANELGCDIKALEELYKYNLRIRKVYDWLDIAGACTEGKKYT